MKVERTVYRVLREYHDSVVHVKGGARVSGCGRRIKPMTTEVAAESAGMKIGDFRKRLDINQPEHRPFLDSWICNLMDGMDTASLDELEHALGRMVFQLPEETPDSDIVMREAISLGKEFGDVMRALREYTDKASEQGKTLSAKERKHIAIELRELIYQACVTLAVVEEE